LNHSNIAAIYGVEKMKSRHFLVMDLVSGETLADRLKRGAIPIEELLPIANIAIERFSPKSMGRIVGKTDLSGATAHL
jgi:hypothetical protein